MGDKNQTSLKDEHGFTLAEVLASIVILSIILISVLLIFIQTMKANKTSEEIIDATYVAQMEMEKLYAISNEANPSLPDKYQKVAEDNGWEVFEKEYIANDTEYYIEVRKNKMPDQMVRIVVKVYDDTNKTNVKAQMESLLKWGG